MKLFLAAPDNFFSAACASHAAEASFSHFFMKLFFAAPASFFSPAWCVQVASAAKAEVPSADNATARINERMGISIGLFRSEEMARALVARLDRLGATGASIAPRGAITVSVRLQARWNDAGAADAAAIAGRYDAQARDCN